MIDIKKLYKEHQEAFLNMSTRINQIEEVALTLINCLKNGNKILIMGNGGSAGDAQHFAAELTGRFEINERDPLSAIALTTDTSAITAIANDFGYEEIFLRQANAIANHGDVLFGISTSGNSKNISRVFSDQNFSKCVKIALTGDNDSTLSSLSDFVVRASSSSTARVQELHIFIIHCLCAILDDEFKRS